MSKMDTTDGLSGLLSRHNPTYSDGFANRVMKGIYKEIVQKETADIEFYNIYRWVALSGVAAIVLLLFSVYVTEGSFSADALYGLIHYTPDEPLITSLNF